MAATKIAIIAVALICVAGVVFARLWAPLLIDSWRYRTARRSLGTARAEVGDGALAAPLPSEIAKRAVDEVFGPKGDGPFPPGPGVTRGGRSMPVVHSEDPRE